MSKNYLVAAVKIPIIAIIRVLEEYSMHDIQEWYSLFIMSSNYERTLERRGSMGSIGQSITHGDISLRFQLFGWSWEKMVLILVPLIMREIYKPFFFFFFTYISQKLTENIKHDVKHLFHIYETIQFCFFQQKFCVFFHPVTTIQK